MLNTSRHLRSAFDPRCRGSHWRSFSRLVEQLESRCLLSTASVPDTLIAAPALANQIDPFPAGPPPKTPPGPPSSYTPAQVRHAYGFDSVPFLLNQTTSLPDTTYYNANAGKGMTIAIVDAYNDPNIVSDLAAFSTAYGLPQLATPPVVGKPSFSVSYVGGGNNDHLVTKPPANDAGWATEIALDVEWAHAMAPQASIQLFEAAGADYSSLLNAIDWARFSGAQVVSMSFGGGEWSGETSWDSQRFTSYPNQNVTFVASSGDSGSRGGPQWPAVSPNVLGVGGTTLTLSANSISETAWSGSGGGKSVLEPKAAFQNSVPGATARETPDVSYDANPSTGVAVYNTYQTKSPWAVYGGTSAGAPQWAALIAIADQGRKAIGQPPLEGSTQTLYALYSLANSSSFRDITSGSNGAYKAATGYDMVTGLGSPLAQYLIPALVSVTGTNGGVTVSPSGSVIGGTATQTAAATPIAIDRNPGSQTQTSTSPIIIGIPLTAPAVANSLTPIILFGSTNLVASTFTSPTATLPATNAPRSMYRPIATALPTAPVRPLKPLDTRSTIDEDLPGVRFFDAGTIFPASGANITPHDEALMVLDLLAIARNAQALGHVPGTAESPGEQPFAPLSKPLLTDLSVRDKPPTLDPVLASAVVVLGGVLALRTHRSARRRHWSLRPIGPIE